MIIGKRYSIDLYASISGKTRLTNATLRAISDSTLPSVSTVIAEHATTLYRLPDALKAVDIYADSFYHFMDSSGVAVVIPLSYINVSTIQETGTVSRTVVFTLANDTELTKLVTTLDNAGFTYRLP